jgi:hypothetical protein
MPSHQQQDYTQAAAQSQGQAGDTNKTYQVQITTKGRTQFSADHWQAATRKLASKIFNVSIYAFNTDSCTKVSNGSRVQDLRHRLTRDEAHISE